MGQPNTLLSLIKISGPPTTSEGGETRMTQIHQQQQEQGSSVGRSGPVLPPTLPWPIPAFYPGIWPQYTGIVNFSGVYSYSPGACFVKT